jgi:hypothetical protein
MTHERFVFGVTIDQIDELSELLRTIMAIETRSRSAMRSTCSPGACRRWGRPSSTRPLPCGKFSIRSTSRSSNRNGRHEAGQSHFLTCRTGSDSVGLGPEPRNGLG